MPECFALCIYACFGGWQRGSGPRPDMLVLPSFRLVFLRKTTRKPRTSPEAVFLPRIKLPTFPNDCLGPTGNLHGAHIFLLLHLSVFAVFKTEKIRVSICLFAVALWIIIDRRRHDL